MIPPLTQQEAELLILARRLIATLRALSGASPSTTGPTRQDTLSSVVLQQILQEIRSMSATLSTELAQLRADVAAQNTVIASATAAFEGLAAQLKASEAAALDAGASTDQIASLTQLREDLEANTSALSSAISANTPAADGAAMSSSPASSAASQPAAADAASSPAIDASTGAVAGTVAPAAAQPTTVQPVQIQTPTANPGTSSDL